MGNRKSILWMGLAGAMIFSLAGILFAWTDVEKHKSCAYCGMDREKFAQSRMLIAYSDGSETPLCSLHCAAVDLAVSLDKTPKAIQVADFGTKELINSEQAFWVVGGSNQGVMTKRAKWAFSDKPKAEAFAKEKGGQITSFDDAMKAAYEDMYADTKMIRERRRMAKMKLSMEKGHGH